MPYIPSPLSTLSTTSSATSTVSSVFSSKSTASSILTAPQRSPIALSPGITTRGCPRSPREETKRTRAHSFYNGRSKSPLRSPEAAVNPLFDQALQKASSDTASTTDEIIARQTEINARQHDIAIWKRKIQAAEKLIGSLQDQVKVLVEEAREKQDVERELEGQRDALSGMGNLTEKELQALQLTLQQMNFKHTSQL